MCLFPAQSLLTPRLVSRDELRLVLSAAHRGGGEDVRLADGEEVRPQPSNGQLPDTGQQLSSEE